VPRPSRAQLQAFFRPRNIALVGASDKSAWSRLIFSRFATYGHEGALYAVNRSGSSAHGLPGFIDIADIPGGVDMAYVYVPASAASDALRQAAAAGVRNVVMLSSGFSEVGAEGAAMQAELSAVADELGVTMLGPNSMGFANIADRCVCTSLPHRLPVRSGRLGLVSQSGAIASQLGKFAHAQGIGLSFIGATGNEAQLGIADLVDYLVDDHNTGAIALYVEAINDPDRFIEAALRARAAAKPIAVLKLGRSAVSSAVAQAHTGSLVGDDAVFDAVCRRYGVIRVNSIEELVLTADFLEKTGPIDPPRVGLVSISGGVCAMYADLAHVHGLAVTQHSERTRLRLRDILPSFATILNPLDLTGAAIQDPTLWTRTIAALAGDPSMGLIVSATVLPVTPEELSAQRSEVEAIVAGYELAGKPPVLCSVTIQDRSETLNDLIRETGVRCVLPDLDFGVRALAHLQSWSEMLGRDAPPRASPPPAPVEKPAGEFEVLAYLASRGVPVVPAKLVRGGTEAVEVARRFAGAVALKIASPDIAHKTEAGGVRLNVVGAEAVADAVDEIMRAVAAHSPDARIDGVLVAPMRAKGTELIVGVTIDPTWGPVLVVGIGGIFAEVYQDSRLCLLPASQDEVVKMLRDLRGAKLLEGFRGEPAANLRRVAEVILRIGDAALGLGPDLETLEVNPLRVHGEDIECLDGLATYSRRS
jgi:acyl-CoA synthetase (NDP forming)